MGLEKSPENAERLREGLEVVEHLTRQLHRQLGRGIDADDLRSAGREGLTLAVRDFDPSRGVPFRRWANLRVRGAMLDAVRSQGGLPRRVYRQVRALEAATVAQEGRLEDDAARPPGSPAEADAQITDQLQTAAMAMAMSFLSMRGTDDAIRAADDRPDPEEAVAREELLGRIREAIATLPDAERTLLQRHYFEDVTFDQVAKEIGLSKSWASRLHTRALETVSKTLGNPKR